jgi:sulfane dehydrogenase subunit SoxC
MDRKHRFSWAPDARPISKQPGRIDRRTFLARGAGIAGAAAAGMTATTARAADDAPLAILKWMQAPGAPFRGYGMPSRFEEPVKRTFPRPYGDLAPGTGPSFTPHEALEGTITPSGLHFERHHNGVPDIDSAQHRLLIHGLVRKPLVFTVSALLRYPMVSRICFIECSGNSNRNLVPKPLQIPCGALHGLISCSEWTGIPLSLLLEEAGIEGGAKWLLAEGADSAAMSRSIPIEKAFGDAMIALYQNGERLRPEQGYPVRLLLPGWEGNMSVKWLRRIKATDGPTQTKDETSKYTDPMPDGKARQFTFAMEVKSVITRPSSGMTMQGTGLYEISGIAWTGAGRITRVEVSTDGGASWKEAALQGQSLPLSLVRFRIPWEWNGVPAMLQSRATDEKGQVQPPRKSWVAEFAPDIRFHNNSIITWAVNADGRVQNVYL